MEHRTIENNNIHSKQYLQLQDGYEIANLNKDEIELIIKFEKDFMKITNKECVLIALEGENKTLH